MYYVGVDHVEPCEASSVAFAGRECHCVLRALQLIGRLPCHEPRPSSSHSPSARMPDTDLVSTLPLPLSFVYWQLPVAAAGIASTSFAHPAASLASELVDQTNWNIIVICSTFCRRLEPSKFDASCLCQLCSASASACCYCCFHLNLQFRKFSQKVVAIVLSLLFKWCENNTKIHLLMLCACVCLCLCVGGRGWDGLTITVKRFAFCL